MIATINQTESTVDIVSTEFPLNDFWTRCKQAIDGYTKMEEKIGGLVELTVVPFIVNVVCQILLLVIGRQPQPPSSCAYFNKSIYKQKMTQLSNLLKINKSKH